MHLCLPEGKLRGEQVAEKTHLAGSGHGAVHQRHSCRPLSNWCKTQVAWRWRMARGARKFPTRLECHHIYNMHNACQSCLESTIKNDLQWKWVTNTSISLCFLQIKPCFFSIQTPFKCCAVIVISVYYYLCSNGLNRST